MQTTVVKPLPRRAVLVGAALAAIVVAAPFAPVFADAGARAGSGDGSEDAVRRLLLQATHNAFATLSRPDGFWNSPVARIPLPVLFTVPGAYRGPLASEEFRDKLQHRLNRFAEAGATAAGVKAPAAIRRAAIPDPLGVLRGSRTATTTAVRDYAGPRLINAMLPTIYRNIRRARDPLVIEAMTSLKGVDERDVARALANETDNAVWLQIGLEEAAIRASPDAGGDPVLAAALRRR